MNKLSKLVHLVLRRPYRSGLRAGAAAAVEHSAFLKLKTYRTIIDVGANKGQFALAARFHNPDAEIVAFEPLAGPRAILTRIFSRDAKTRIFPVAIGSRAEKLNIHVSKRVDSSSLLPIGKLQSQIFPGTEEARIEEVQVARLHDIVAAADIHQPALLKMDVQGFELEVLKGSEPLLGAITDIYVELSFLPLYDNQPLAHDVIAWLAERGFGLAGIYHTVADKDGRSVQADVCFCRV